MRVDEVSLTCDQVAAFVGMKAAAPKSGASEHRIDLALTLGLQT
jgi:hypothetical protein